MRMLIAFVGVSTLMSVITLGVYWWDKRAAARGSWRTPERTLHTLALLGGWPGAFLAMRFIRHKNRKPGFVALTVLIALSHVAVGVFLAWHAFTTDGS